MLEHWSCGHSIDRCCHILNIPHSSGDKCRAILQWGTNMVVSICKPPPCTHFQQYNCKLIPITARRSHPAQYGEDRFGPPTLERSGSEHRVGRFTSFLLRRKAWLEVELPLERETEGFEKIPSLMGKSDASECNESSLSNCREQLILCKTIIK